MASVKTKCIVNNIKITHIKEHNLFRLDYIIHPTLENKSILITEEILKEAYINAIDILLIEEPNLTREQSVEIFNEIKKYL